MSLVEEEEILETDEFQDLDTDTLNKDAILFAVDCHPSMFYKHPEEPSPFYKALKCISTVFKNKIISSPDDFLGILFFHCQKMVNSTNFPHIYLFHSLEQPDAPIMQRLEQLIRGELKIEDIIGDPSEVEIPTGNVFWTCGSILTQNLKNSVKRVFFFTNQDNPHGNNPTLKRAAKTRARDLDDLGIELTLFPLEAPNKKFDMFHFYRDIVTEEGEEVERFPDTSKKFSELESHVRRKEAKRRALKRTYINLGPDISLSVRLYSLLQEARKAGGQFVWLEAETNAISYPNTQWFLKETGAPLAKQEIKLSFNYGGKPVLFSSEEVNELKSFGQPGISLICFVLREKIKFIEHHLSKATFIFPDEYQIKGSSAIFLSLSNELANQNKVAICRYVARKGIPPRLVALVPQIEQIDEAGYQIKSAGFHLVPLPYAEEIRHLSFNSDEHKPASIGAIDKAKEIISKLVLGDAFNPDNYENPSIQKFYAYLQALALDEEDVEELEDATLPDIEMIEKRTDKLLDQLKDLTTAPSQQEPPEQHKKKKAKISKEEDGNENLESPKERKTKKTRGSKESEEDEDIICEIDFEKLGKEDALSQLTVNDLKDFLSGVGQKPKRLKADLVDQVKEYFQVNMRA